MFKVLVGKPAKRSHLEHIDVERSVILKQILKNRWKAWSQLIWFRIRADGRLL
jgi:hypothetical protein